jgi:hypothetical protein
VRTKRNVPNTRRRSWEWPSHLANVVASKKKSNALPALLSVLQPLHDEWSVPLPNFDFDRRSCRQLQNRRSLTWAQMS